MSEKYIPENVDPFRLAEQSLHIGGLVKLVNMHRLNANRKSDIRDADEIASCELRFGVDRQGQAYVEGHLDAKLNLQCQRCMEPFKYEIISDFALGIVKKLDETKSLPSQYEPAMVKDGQLALRDLIEDELILNLPIIPIHEPDACKMKLPRLDSGSGMEKGESPFQVLQSLKQKQK